MNCFLVVSFLTRSLDLFPLFSPISLKKKFCYQFESFLFFPFTVLIFFSPLYSLFFPSSSLILSLFLCGSRPDMTSAVDWALKANYRTIFLCGLFVCLLVYFFVCLLFPVPSVLTPNCIASCL